MSSPVGETRERWFLAKNPQQVKRMHRADCKYAAREYAHMSGKSVSEVVEHLCQPPSYPIQWHDACTFCARDLRDAMWDVLGITKEPLRA